MSGTFSAASDAERPCGCFADKVPDTYSRPLLSSKEATESHRCSTAELKSLRGTLCLVTGGAGFIGSHLVDALLVQGARVRVLDNFSTGFRHNLDHLAVKQAVEVLEGDASDADVVAKAMRGVEIVFHEAAMASVPRSMREPDLCHAWCADQHGPVVAGRRRR